MPNADGDGCDVSLIACDAGGSGYFIQSPFPFTARPDLEQSTGGPRQLLPRLAYPRFKRHKKDKTKTKETLKGQTKEKRYFPCPLLLFLSWT